MELMKQYGMDPVHKLVFSGMETTGSKYGENIFKLVDTKKNVKFYVRSGKLADLINFDKDINISGGVITTTEGWLPVFHREATLIPMDPNNSAYQEILRKNGKNTDKPLRSLQFGDVPELDYKDKYIYKDLAYIGMINLNRSIYDYIVLNKNNVIISEGSVNYDGKTSKTKVGLFVIGKKLKIIPTNRKVISITRNDSKEYPEYRNIKTSLDYLYYLAEKPDIRINPNNFPRGYDVIFSNANYRDTKLFEKLRLEGKIEAEQKFSTFSWGRQSYSHYEMKDGSKLLLCQKFIKD